MLKACEGPAQNPRESEPVAFISPATSAAAFAKFPPPRWFISPQASSAQSITYSISPASIPVFLTAYNKASTLVALLIMFSCIT